MSEWVTPERVFDGQVLTSGCSVRLVAGRVVEIAPRRADARAIAGILSPGFVDLQVNGGGGVLLNSNPTPEGMLTIAVAHRACGTVAILPTVITDEADVLARAAEAVLAVRGQAGIIGLHIEGPHISQTRRGTHAARFVRPMEQATLDIVAGLRSADVPVMLTLAPEVASCEDVARLTAMGVVVSIGHSDATAEQVEAAIVAGACCGTHLFNAMAPMTSREPGVVGAILHSEVPFGIICDGYHVDDRMIRLALRAAGPEARAFLVSDAMATIGGPDQFALYDEVVHLRDGRLINAEGGLAGAHITQARGVQRLVADIGLSLEQALQMAVSTPARVMGQPGLARLEARALEDVLVLSEQLELVGTLAQMTQVAPVQS
ncbi:N-acetylglucosamine-6-phosphate deacetylase [Shimia abyssi]|uniref:N-acetylglucosamine 6-phosphate deacetylase n=1 Tax=Shimia abyssi TaxID=1662395 RepID=A0A2P8FDG2_9RHOB|nr:amidohydrolase family protein [Shimia abyssi]PSL19765.1 N-acetylglucosamine 6-phosphate deacetylase [Shimia abyssi]